MGKRKKVNKQKKRKDKQKRLYQKEERLKEQCQLFQIEFADTINAVVEQLSAPVADLPEGPAIQYEISDLEALAFVIKQRLTVTPHTGCKYTKTREGDILLWHGTSLNRAQSILESGFTGKKHDIFFSTNIITCCEFARGRAAREHSEPAIFAAYYEPGTSKCIRRFRHVLEEHYAFRARAASRLVKYFLTCHGLYATGQIIPKTRQFRDNLTNITLTRSSSNMGIAYWINSFLDLHDSECISTDHPGVDRIKAWIDDQYASDRKTPIADEEVLALVTEFLPEYNKERKQI